ncbi:MAG: T9SS type A sorting domain-containing protein [Balneolales bacterium]|nr:T9SS type A sorting domain-containing protein [Balneolales bacterium]
MRYFLIPFLITFVVVTNTTTSILAQSSADSDVRILTVPTVGSYHDKQTAISSQSGWNPLPSVNMSRISPDSIGDWLIDRPVSQGPDYDINYYLAHFHRVANAVRTNDPNKGFIDIVVWRNAVDNEPYNARIMESITTLAWFYTQEQEWNPYYANEDLRKILEAALSFWVSIQNTDGRFSEYGVNRWNLAATAFATKFMGKTLELLEDGPPIDATIHDQVKLANRKALMVVFSSESLYNHGIRFSNQYGNAFTGALSHLSLNPDDSELREAFEARLETSLNDFQSPAGYFYEQFGPDWSYAFGTHHSNVLMAWHYVRHNPQLAAHYAEEHAKFIDWLSYNAVLQPDGINFVLHSSIQSRQSRNILGRLESPLSEVVPLARAFNVTQEEAEERLASVRQRVTSNWTNIPSLQVGNFSGYSAYAFLHRDHYRWNPTEVQRQEAVQNLPYLASDNFIQQRVDNLTYFETTYVRKEDYYAAFSAGAQQQDQQRYGLGLLWSPVAGTLIQSQSRSNDAAWGTFTINNRVVSPWEALPLEAVYTLDGVPFEPEAGVGDLDGQLLEISYPLGSTGIFSGLGTKKLTFDQDEIKVEVTHNGSFKEILPLVVSSALELRIDEARGTIQLIQLGRLGYEKLRIEIDNPESITSIESLSLRSIGSGLNVIPVHITASDSLVYTITITPNEPLSIDERGSLDIPAGIQLIGNYPNPFNPTTRVVYDLEQASDVRLHLYNSLGERVLLQNHGFRNVGRHTVTVDASNLASGVYIVKIEASGQYHSLPVTLLK